MFQRVLLFLCHVFLITMVTPPFFLCEISCIPGKEGGLIEKDVCGGGHSDMYTCSDKMLSLKMCPLLIRSYLKVI